MQGIAPRTFDPGQPPPYVRITQRHSNEEHVGSLCIVKKMMLFPTKRFTSQPVTAFHRQTLGHSIDIKAISVAEENIFHNYDDSEPATIKFFLSNKNVLTLYFPESQTCLLLLDAHGKPTNTPSAFKQHFNAPIGFVPILGPVEHHEPLYLEETAQRSLYTYGAARNFRNIWFHLRENFEDFRALLQPQSLMQ